MSQLKVNSISDSAGANGNAITLANDGTCTVKATNRSSNLIINGSMICSQRGTSSTSDGYQTVDRFKSNFAGHDEAITQAQVDLSSSDTPYSLGFRKAFKLTNGNQTSGTGASDYAQMSYTIEAQDIATSGWNYTDTNSKLTLQFWAKSSVAKTFILSLYTQDGTDYAYNHKYALAANTWTKITHTFPGNSNLTFDNDNGIGIQFMWKMFVGTTYTSGSTVDQWVTYGGYTSTPDDTDDWWTTNDATFEMTGVQLEIGDVATSFEHLSFGTELARCQRYYQRSYDYGTAVGTVTNNGSIFSSLSVSQAYASAGTVNFPVQMRAVPTMLLYSTSSGTVGKMNADGTDGNGVAYSQGMSGSGFVRSNDSSGTGINVYMRCHYTAEAEL